MAKHIQPKGTADLEYSFVMLPEDNREEQRDEKKKKRESWKIWNIELAVLTFLYDSLKMRKVINGGKYIFQEARLLTIYKSQRIIKDLNWKEITECQKIR